MTGEPQKVEIILHPLQEQFIEPYLNKFSATVMTALRVAHLESERTYLTEALLRQQAGQTHFYCIFDANSNQLIGAVEIRNPDTSRGQLYTWLHESYWGSGIFLAALQMAAFDYFKKTKALYFDATVDCDNMRSYRALKKVGFADLGIKEGPFEKQFVLILRNKNMVRI